MTGKVKTGDHIAQFPFSAKRRLISLVVSALDLKT